MRSRTLARRGLGASLLALVLGSCAQHSTSQAPPPPDPRAGSEVAAPTLQPQLAYRGALYLSDLSWTRAVSGYGPVERDRANGDVAANDGGPLIIEGVRYNKGLGVHSNSEVVYTLGGTCSNLTATVGLNDYKLNDALGASGSVVFQVYADGTKVFDSGVMRGNTPAKSVSVNLSGKGQLRLVTTDAGDGRVNDHADWADARVTCAADDQTGVGLGAEYYATPDLSGTPREGVDGVVNFDWLYGPPLSGLPADRFSARWSGFVQAKFSEVYTFSVIADDNVRLWVNGQLLIDAWTTRAPTEARGTVTLTAGQPVPIKLEYADGGDASVVRLLWSSASQPKQVVPRGALTPARPSVTTILPVAGSTGARRDLAVSANTYPGTFGIGVDAGTLAGNVHLYRSDDAGRTNVPGNPGTDGAGGNITYQPLGLLDPFTSYTFEVTSGVKDTRGAPFIPYRASFVTGAEPAPVAPSVNFVRKQVYPDPNVASSSGAPISSITLDRAGTYLYGVTLDGRILRWTVLPGGDLALPAQVLALPELRGRAIVGLRFDPQNPQVLWITNSDPLYPEPARDFSGKISKLTIASGAAFGATLQDYLVGLPRSIKDHLTNSVAFGPDGFLYVAQGSTSAAGALDGYWTRPERLLSGAILRVDPRRVSGLPINVQTETYEGVPGSYNPFAAGAPVTVYAAGVRNAYDLVWHTNGHLYIPANGSAAGGNTPASPDGRVPALKNAPNQPDFLFRTNTPGGYFGHPNPLRGQYVLNGGNPTDGFDTAEVVNQSPYAGYPVGVQPDPNYRKPVWTFGYNRSPNGAIQYRSATFGGALKDKLLVVEYAGGDDILALGIDASGNVQGAQKIGVNGDATAPFVNPLDLAEDGRNGNLYVAELVRPTSQSRITLLRPAP